VAKCNSKKELIENNLDKIKEWIGQGVPMKIIAKNIGVCVQTLYTHLKSESLDTIKNARQPAVQNLENTMFTSAQGYTRTVKKYQKVKRCVYENGKKAEEWEEMVEYEEEVYYPPDTTAGIFLLKNWGNYMNEPRAMEIRKKEVELKEKQVEANLW
jgi:IS30 family transposase